MAVVVITPQTPPSTGLEVLYAPAEDASGFLVPNDGNTLIGIKNGNVGAGTTAISFSYKT